MKTMSANSHGASADWVSCQHGVQWGSGTPVTEGRPTTTTKARAGNPDSWAILLEVPHNRSRLGALDSVFKG